MVVGHCLIWKLPDTDSSSALSALAVCTVQWKSHSHRWLHGYMVAQQHVFEGYRVVFQVWLSFHLKQRLGLCAVHAFKL
jgi:hypothetical protein